MAVLVKRTAVRASGVRPLSISSSVQKRTPIIGVKILINTTTPTASNSASALPCQLRSFSGSRSPLNPLPDRSRPAAAQAPVPRAVYRLSILFKPGVQGADAMRCADEVKKLINKDTSTHIVYFADGPELDGMPEGTLGCIALVPDGSIVRWLSPPLKLYARPDTDGMSGRDDVHDAFIDVPGLKRFPGSDGRTQIYTAAPEYLDSLSKLVEGTTEPGVEEGAVVHEPSYTKFAALKAEQVAMGQLVVDILRVEGVAGANVRAEAVLLPSPAGSKHEAD